jgi:START domain-containing protein
MVLLSLLLALPVSAKNPVDKDGWELISTKGEVQVFRRDNPGDKLKSLRGIGVVDQPVWKVALVLLDDDRAPEWVDSLDESRVVRQMGPYEYVEYNHIKMPVVRNREFVTHVTMSVDAPQKIAVIRSEPIDDPTVPSRPKTVRGEIRGYYEMKSIDGGKRTLLTIELHSDPKGRIPAWIVNLFQKDWARETIAGIRKQSAKGDLKPPAAFAKFLEDVQFNTP